MKGNKAKRNKTGYCGSLFGQFFYDFDTESRCPYVNEDHETIIMLERKEMEHQYDDQRWVDEGQTGWR
jgi:hypothetical protein